MTLSRRLTAEFIGTFFLLAAVVGSGIMGDNLSGGNDGLALLANAIATGAALAVLILVFGPVSGGHFNPAVTLSFLLTKQITTTDGSLYIMAQVLGGVLGVVVAHLMFGLPLVQDSTIARTGLGQYVGEFVATFGLLATILGCLRFRAEAVPYAVGLYITAAYWFTSSTSFANPAVTIARGLTDTFAGIRMVDVPLFIVVQLVGAVVATLVFGWLLKSDD
jgi:glycerol uptake facilitator-like aquaporin